MELIKPASVHKPEAMHSPRAADNVKPFNVIPPKLPSERRYSPSSILPVIKIITIAKRTR